MTVTIRDVERAVCLRFQLSHEDILARSPRRALSRPRQIAMYLARELTGASYPRLGRHFCRDHTSVLHGCRAIGKRIQTDGRLRAQVEGCKEILAHRASWKDAVAREVASHGLARPTGPVAQARSAAP